MVLAGGAAQTAGTADEETGQATSRGLSVRAVAEVKSPAADVLEPALRVVPGDEVIYTLEIRNMRATPVLRPVICFAIPSHARYLAESAVGPGAEVAFSVDGGRHFSAADELRVPDGHGGSRPAATAEYTHIRWRLRQALKPNSVAFARFRALVE